MSLLKVDAVHADDASAHGEDLAKGSSNLLLAGGVAFVATCLALLIFFWTIHTPPVVAGDVVHVWVHPMHTITTPVDAAGVRQAPLHYDEVFVFALVRYRNQSDKPVTFKEMTTNITFDDGIHTSYGVSATDYDRIFLAYPDMAPLRSKPLLRDVMVQPKEMVDGMVISSFKVTKAQWDARKDMNFTLEFQFHPNLVLVPQGQPTEQ